MTGNGGSGGEGGQAPTCEAPSTQCGASCVDTKTDPKHCGDCGNACALPNSPATCQDGACVVGSCNAGFGDCDLVVTNGCESDAASDVANCGSCGKACAAPPNASASCMGGTCGLVDCDMDFGNCDLDPVNGCEVPLLLDVKNCGACGKACGPTSLCKAGACKICPLKLLPKVDYAAGTSPLSIEAGDFNNDSKLDLVVANFPGGGNVLYGKGDGTFGVKNAFSAGPFPMAVAVADLNGDKELDVATANYGGSANGDTVSVLLGYGNGTFGSMEYFKTGIAPYDIAAADINGDGKPDLVTADLKSNTVSVLLGNGDGTFKAKIDHPTGLTPTSVAIGDFTGDGKPDAVVANAGINAVSLHAGNGDGTFKARVEYAVGDSPMFVGTADLDGDKNLDVLVANTFSMSIGILINAGNGAFKPMAGYPTGSHPNAATAADFNGDGKLDVAAVSGGSSTVAIFPGKGDGSLDAPFTYSTSYQPNSSAAGDFNGDGKVDLAVTNGNDQSVSVFMNGACTM